MTARAGQTTIREYAIYSRGQIDVRGCRLFRSEQAVWVLDVENAGVEITLVDAGELCVAGPVEIVIVCFAERRHDVLTGEIENAIDPRGPFAGQDAGEGIERPRHELLPVEPTSVRELVIVIVRRCLGRQLCGKGSEQDEKYEELFHECLSALLGLTPRARQ